MQPSAKSIDDCDLLLSSLKFPEAPRWHAGRLWLSDQHAHRILALDSDGHAEIVAQLDDMPSGLGFLPDGTLLVAAIRSRRVLRIEGGKVSTHADLSSLRPGWLNDMVVDGQGRAYVGFNQGRYAGEPGTQPDWVMLVRPDGSHRIVADDVERPNGCVISADGRTMVLAQSRARVLTAYDIESDGRLSHPRTFAHLENARPDGICLDAEGAVWLGSPAAQAFVRVKEGGEFTDRIETRDRFAIACALGGVDRKTLFMLTARTTRENLRKLTDAEADARSESTGWVHAAQVAVPGVGGP